MRRIVVAGASLAGLRAAEAVRAAGFDGELTIIGAERHPPYSRPPLSKDFLRGAVDQDRIAFPSRVDATWRLGTRLTALDLDGRTVEIDRHERLPFDGLVIATGRAARPWPEPVPRGVHTLRDVDDALTLRAEAAPGSRAVIVGAGFVGCEVAATLSAHGLAVTVIGHAALPLPALGEEVSAFVADEHRRHGVELCMSATVAGFDTQDGRVSGVWLSDGRHVPADLCVVATGSVPNTAWVQGSGLAIDGGIVCDAQCFALGVDSVTVAGDVARWPHPLADGDLIRVEHWTNAAQMGQVAGSNLVVGPADSAAHESVPSFWTDQYDVKVKAVGLPTLADCFQVAEGCPADGRFVVTGLRRGRMVAVIAVGMPRRIPVYRKALAVAEQVLSARPA